MDETNQRFTAGVWLVKSGKEKEKFMAKMKELCDELIIPVPIMNPVIHLKR
jgi:hypothetical protein